MGRNGGGEFLPLLFTVFQPPPQEILVDVAAVVIIVKQFRFDVFDIFDIFDQFGVITVLTAGVLMAYLNLNPDQLIHIGSSRTLDLRKEIVAVEIEDIDGTAVVVDAEDMV
ncbi:hypothetical protein Glove_33g39 [Diversispora epigaea]|uniref:Uncharacterized protein n=1 Tax=Diversispora epigaea TaxID=1348612 RepID=A0A397JTF0_9GLOM|nr:hypothetical protein Glove_33g39 [Diversispora epigaea]